MEVYKSIREKLVALYGESRGSTCYQRLMNLLDTFQAAYPNLANSTDPAGRISERDVMLITYGDTLLTPDKSPLQTLHKFLRVHFSDVLSAVYVLPFFPYSSDYGFSVIDYKAVNPELGTWDAVRELGAAFDLMFDAVVNHISSKRAWFQGFLVGDLHYQGYFITIDA